MKYWIKNTHTKHLIDNTKLPFKSLFLILYNECVLTHNQWGKRFQNEGLHSMAEGGK